MFLREARRGSLGHGLFLSTTSQEIPKLRDAFHFSTGIGTEPRLLFWNSKTIVTMMIATYNGSFRPILT